MPLVQTIFNKTMASMGQEVKNHLCAHFEHSRADLFNIIFVKGLKDFASVMKECGKDADSTGCEGCKPTIGSIIASLFNKHLLDEPRRGLQDTNDRFLANIQRNGTFSVVPRMSGGEVTPKSSSLLALWQRNGTSTPRLQVDNVLTCSAHANRIFPISGKN